MSRSAVLQRRPVRSPVRERLRPPPNDVPTAMRPDLTHRAEGPARPCRAPHRATPFAPGRQPECDSSILRSFHVLPQTNRRFHLQKRVQRLQDGFALQRSREVDGLLNLISPLAPSGTPEAVSYTHLRAHETRHDLVCRLLL